MKSFRPALALLAFLSIQLNSHTQQIDTVILVKSLNTGGEAVMFFDDFFDLNNQYIAYSKTSNDFVSDTLVLYDLKHDAVKYKTKRNQPDYDLKFINENRFIYFNSDDTIRSISNFNSPAEHILYVQPKYTGHLCDFAFSKDNKMLVTLSYTSVNFKRLIKWFDYNVLSDSIDVIDSTYINDIDLEADIAISDDKKYVALNGVYHGDSVTIVNLETKEVNVINTSPNGGTYSPVFFRQNDKLKVAVGGAYLSGSIEIIDVETLSLEKSVPLFDHYVYSVAVDSSEQYLACGGYDRTLGIYSIKDLAFDTLFTAGTGMIDQIKFSSDNKFVLVSEEMTGLLDIYEIIDSSQFTAIANPEPDDVIIYPVPVKDRLILKNSAGINRFLLYSVKGELIKSEPVTDGEIDFTDVPSGLYLISFYNNNSEVSHKKIIRE
ncbi:MAG TPA: T9SS type A sorting domain-containing protein [Bacteroidales bacterium]|nr:T9SS type A sorting domain-containing protein [Bacteroidales bacterium]